MKSNINLKFKHANNLLILANKQKWNSNSIGQMHDGTVNWLDINLQGEMQKAF